VFKTHAIKNLPLLDTEIEKKWIAESKARYDAFARVEAEEWGEIKIRYEC